MLQTFDWHIIVDFMKKLLTVDTVQHLRRLSGGQ